MPRCLCGQPGCSWASAAAIGGGSPAARSRRRQRAGPRGTARQAEQVERGPEGVVTRTPPSRSRSSGRNRTSRGGGARSFSAGRPTTSTARVGGTAARRWRRAPTRRSAAPRRGRAARWPSRATPRARRGRSARRGARRSARAGTHFPSRRSADRSASEKWTGSSTEPIRTRRVSTSPDRRRWRRRPCGEPDLWRAGRGPRSAGSADRVEPDATGVQRVLRVLDALPVAGRLGVGELRLELRDRAVELGREALRPGLRLGVRAAPVVLLEQATCCSTCGGGPRRGGPGRGAPGRPRRSGAGSAVSRLRADCASVAVSSGSASSSSASLAPRLSPYSASCAACTCALAE